MATLVTEGGSLFDRKSTWGIFAVLIAILFLVTNLPWHLDNFDQAKQAFTSFQMVEQGQWLFQRAPTGQIGTKPPLIGWVSALCYEVTRSWEIAWRLPSLAAALALAVVLTRATITSYGLQAGLVGMSAFGLNLFSPRLATLVRTEMPLALIVFLLGLWVWRKIRTAEPWTPRDRLIVFGLLTAAMLVKGPIVYAFLLPGIVAFQFLNRKPNVSAWCGWWPWFASLAVFLAWVTAGLAWVPLFYEQVVLREFAGRFSETVHRTQPIYFYFPHLLHKFAPWSILLLALGVLGWRAKKIKLRERWQSLQPEVVWLICWSLGGLLLMSLIPSKRVDRIFPMVPPLCLLLAAQVGQLAHDSALARRVRRWSVVALVFACLLTSGYALQRISTSYRSNEAALVRFGATVRQEASRGNWHYEVSGVTGGKDDPLSLLLYLRRTRFTERDEVIRRWNASTLDAVVVSADQVPSLLDQLPDAQRSGLEGAVIFNGRPRRYLLLKREAL